MSVPPPGPPICPRAAWRELSGPRVPSPRTALLPTGGSAHPAGPSWTVERPALSPGDPAPVARDPAGWSAACPQPRSPRGFWGPSVTALSALPAVPELHGAPLWGFPLLCKMGPQAGAGHPTASDIPFPLPGGCGAGGQAHGDPGFGHCTPVTSSNTIASVPGLVGVSPGRASGRRLGARVGGGCRVVSTRGQGGAGAPVRGRACRPGTLWTFRAVPDAFA